MSSARIMSGPIDAPGPAPAHDDAYAEGDQGDAEGDVQVPERAADGRQGLGLIGVRPQGTHCASDGEKSVEQDAEANRQRNE